MAAFRRPGYQCAYRDPVNLNDGTLCRAESFYPGATCVHELTTVRRNTGTDREGSKDKIKRLRKEALATPLAGQFRKQLGIGNVPPVVWGIPVKGHKAKWDGEKIVLDRQQMNTLSDCEWEQVIVMELGNAANDTKVEEIYDNASKGLVERDEFADLLQGLEMAVRNQVIKAYTEGQFGDGPSIFLGGVLTLEEYRTTKGNKDLEDYRQIWDKQFKKVYERVKAKNARKEQAK